MSYGLLTLPAPPQTVTYTADLNFDGGPEIVGNAQVRFIPQVTDPGTSTVVANPANPDPVPANGLTESTITVTLRDADGEPRQAVVPVRLTQIGGSGTLGVPADTTTDPNGVATFTVSSLAITIATYEVTVWDPRESDLDQLALVNFVQPLPSAGQSTITVDETSVIANGESFATVTVTGRDLGGQPIDGVFVTLVQDPLGSSDIEPSITLQTGPSSVVSFEVSSDTPSGAPVHYYADAAGVDIEEVFVTFIPQTINATRS